MQFCLLSFPRNMSIEGVMELVRVLLVLRNRDDWGQVRWRSIILVYANIDCSFSVRNNFALMHRRTLSPKPYCSSCLVGLFKLRGAASHPTWTLVTELQTATFYQFRSSQKALQFSTIIWMKTYWGENPQTATTNKTSSFLNSVTKCHGFPLF